MCRAWACSEGRAGEGEGPSGLSSTCHLPVLTANRCWVSLHPQPQFISCPHTVLGPPATKAGCVPINCNTCKTVKEYEHSPTVGWLWTGLCGSHRNKSHLGSSPDLSPLNVQNKVSSTCRSGLCRGRGSVQKGDSPAAQPYSVTSCLLLGCIFQELVLCYCPLAVQLCSLPGLYHHHKQPLWRVSQKVLYRSTHAAWWRMAVSAHRPCQIPSRCKIINYFMLRGNCNTQWETTEEPRPINVWMEKQSGWCTSFSTEISI